MKMSKFAVAAATLFVSQQVLADSTNFEGLSLKFGMYTVNSNVKFSEGSNSIDGLGAGSFASDISVDYGLSLSPTSVVLIGASYGVSNPTIFKVSAGSDLDGSLEAGSRWSVFAAPGLVVNDKALAYVKLSYNSTKPDGKGNWNDVGRKTFSGFGYGAGVRFLIDKNVHVDLEFMQMGYGSNTYDAAKVSASALFGGIAVGYKF